MKLLAAKAFCHLQFAIVCGNAVNHLSQSSLLSLRLILLFNAGFCASTAGLAFQAVVNLDRQILISAARIKARRHLHMECVDVSHRNYLANTIWQILYSTIPEKK